MRWRCFCESDQLEGNSAVSTPRTDRAVWADSSNAGLWYIGYDANTDLWDWGLMIWCLRHISIQVLVSHRCRQKEPIWLNSTPHGFQVPADSGTVECLSHLIKNQRLSICHLQSEDLADRDWERECLLASPTYQQLGPVSLRIWKSEDHEHYQMASDVKEAQTLLNLHPVIFENLQKQSGKNFGKVLKEMMRCRLPANVGSDPWQANATDFGRSWQSIPILHDGTGNESAKLFGQVFLKNSAVLCGRFVVVLWPRRKKQQWKLPELGCWRLQKSPF